MPKGLQTYCGSFRAADQPWPLPEQNDTGSVDKIFNLNSEVEISMRRI
jgi:hypothetical protein